MCSKRPVRKTTCASLEGEMTLLASADADMVEVVSLLMLAWKVDVEMENSLSMCETARAAVVPVIYLNVLPCYKP